LNGSGVGVTTAAIANTATKTYRRRFVSHERWITPSLMSAQMRMGISNTTPMPTMNSVTNERYSEARSWLSITSLPKLMRNLSAFGRRTR